MTIGHGKYITPFQSSEQGHVLAQQVLSRGVTTHMSRDPLPLVSHAMVELKAKESVLSHSIAIKSLPQVSGNGKLAS